MTPNPDAWGASGDCPSRQNATDEASALRPFWCHYRDMNDPVNDLWEALASQGDVLDNQSEMFARLLDTVEALRAQVDALAREVTALRERG